LEIWAHDICSVSMKSVRLRYTFWLLFIALLLLAAIKFAPSYFADSKEGDQLATKSKMRTEKADRDSERQRTRHLTDTSKLRKEALELLNRTPENTHIMEILPEAARLSAIFREWGEADFEEAKQFLETEPLAMKSQNAIQTFAGDLILAAIIGYGNANPSEAWNFYTNIETIRNSDGIDLLSGISSDDYFTTTEHIMRNLFIQSPDEAVEKLRKLGEHDRMAKASSLRAIFAESNDSALVDSLYAEFLGEGVNGLHEYAGIVFSGLAQKDPTRAWQYFHESSKRLITSVNSVDVLSSSMMGMWAQEQPQEALRFIEEYKTDHLADPKQTSHLIFYLVEQYEYQPEWVVKALESKELEGQVDAHVHVVLICQMKYHSWPLLDEDVPLTKDARLERLEKALETSSLSASRKGKIAEIIRIERER